MEEKIEETDFSPEAILDHYQDLVYHMELKANWLIGISSVVLILIITRYSALVADPVMHTGLIIIMAGCFLAIFNLIFILVPRIVPSRKHKQALRDVNLFEYRNLQRHFSREEFAGYVRKLRQNQSEVDKLYATAIYQMVNIRLPSNSRKLRIGGWSLIVSLLLGTVVILINFI